MIQFSGDSMYKFVGLHQGKSGDRDFYSVQITDGEGAIVRLYTDAVTFGRLKTLAFGDEFTPVISLYQTQRGLGCTMVDFMGPSHA